MNSHSSPPPPVDLLPPSLECECGQSVAQRRAMNEAEDELKSELARLRAEFCALKDESEGYQTQLERERAHFHSVFEGMGEGLLITDLDDRIQYANGKMTQICGFSRDEMIGRVAYEVFLPRDEWPTLHTRNERRAAGLSDSYETLLQHKSGERVWVLIHATPLRDASGEVVGTIGAQVEITKRKSAEMALQESEKRLRSVVEHAVDGFIVHGFNGDLLEVNGAQCQSLGWSREEMLRKNVRDFELDFDEQKVQQKWDCLRRKGGNAGVNGRQMRRDGGVFPVEVHIGCVEWNGQPALLALVRDTSERRKMEAELREALLERRLIMETVPDVLFRLDLEGRLVAWNRKLETVTGLSPQELQNRPGLDFFAASDQPRISEAITRAFRDGFSQVEAPFLRADGLLVPFSFSSVPLCDESGQVLGLTGTARDISDRLKTEEGTRLALREKEVLLKEVHHRVKNNLQIINSLLSLQAEAISDERVKAAFAESQMRIRAMALIHETLYSSGDLGRIDVRAYCTRLTNALVRGYSQTAQKVEVQLDIPSGLVLPLDAAVPCGLIINELVTNSFKYAFPDSRSGHILLRVEQEDGKWTLQVGDDGVGLPEMDLENVHSTGLQLVTGLCDQLEARFRVEREGGTRWTISFITP